MTHLRIGTRASALAVWQAEHVRDLLLARHDGLTVELVKISTKGDRVLDRPLAEIGGKGLFVREIEVALADGDIDLAVHSLKDMPTEQPPGLELSTFPARASAFDALCPRVPGMTLATLPAGARIGTGSIRRQAQLLAARPDIECVGIRGNIQTRLGKRDPASDNLDAVVLARAGLERMELWEPHYTELGPPDILPAPAQGALAIEIRADDDATRALVAPLDDYATRLAVLAERACLAAIEGNCHTPFAAWARPDGDGLAVTARLMSDGHTTEGRRMVILRDDPLAQAVQLGHTLGHNLLERHLHATGPGRR